jgi:hypothetical protein
MNSCDALRAIAFQIPLRATLVILTLSRAKGKDLRLFFSVFL